MAETIIQLRDANNTLFVDLSVPAPPADNRFYVAFHGLVTLVEGPGDEFHAYALNMRGDHQYRLGNWLLETDLPRGFSATLRGVSASPKTAANSLDPTLTPTILVTALPDAKDERIWASLTLPRPRKIHYLRLGDAVVSNPAKLIAPATKVCGLTVFEYAVTTAFDYIELASPDGFQRYWQSSSFTEFPNHAKVATLHLIDSPPDQPVSAMHSQDEFALSTSLFGQMTVQLVGPPKDLAMQPDLPPGLSALELSSLKSRPKLVDHLVDFARTARFSSSQPLNGEGCKSCCSACNASFTP